MTAAMDPYGVLGLQPGASQAEIKRAYRRLAKSLHPDFAGERSLPAFLAVQDAYERLTGTKVRTVRPPTPGGGSASASTSSAGPFREPWRADPARAKAAREQARTRSRAAGSADGAGAATGGSATRSSGTRTGSRTWARDEQRPGASGRASDAGTTGTQRSGGESPPPAGGRRRRTTRKATLGSTSYDEAREATDPRWGGASWYGPTTGEYWIVNPREYADPRKHGPGYSSRLRTGPGETEEPVIGRPEAEAARPAPRRGAPVTERAQPTRDERPPAAADGPMIQAILRSGPADPLWRLGLVLLGWAPVGIAAAAVIGQLTGCASFSAACDGTDPFVPWVAQAIIVGLLLVAPPLSRVFAAGTLGLVVGLVPATALVIVLGGSGSSAAPPVLAGVLAIAWLLGVGWGIRRLLPGRHWGGAS